MTLAFLEIGSVEYMLLLVVFLILVVIMLRLGKKSAENPSRAEALKQRFEHLTVELLEQTPDTELVDGVVAHVMAHTDLKNPDPYYTVMAASRGLRGVYSVWVSVKELTHGSLEDYRKGPSARYAEPAIEGLRLFGAEACAMLLEKAMTAEEPEEIYATAFRDGVKQENPLALAAAYIRENISDFAEDAPADEVSADSAE